MTTTNEISFGKYYDDQRDRLRKMLDDKNAQQNIEWMEDYEKRQNQDQAKQKKIILPLYVDHGIDIIGDEWPDEDEDEQISNNNNEDN